jgi:hypothetical protein
MIVLDDICEKCNHACNAKRFQRNFSNWTSGNNDIDKFIRDTQLLAHKTSEILHALEWIPYDRFYNIKNITNAGMYRANWIDGKISYWNDYNQNWKRKSCNMFVILKCLNNSKDITSKFMSEV